MLSVETLTKVSTRDKALADVSFTVPKGQLVGLIGPSGAGTCRAAGASAAPSWAPVPPRAVGAPHPVGNGQIHEQNQRPGNDKSGTGPGVRAPAAQPGERMPGQGDWRSGAAGGRMRASGGLTAADQIPMTTTPRPTMPRLA